MCSSTYWRRTCCTGAGRGDRAAAVRAAEIRRSVLMGTNLTLALLLAPWSGPARGQAAGRLVPYRDSIPKTLVTFELVPVPGGTVTLDSPAGPRVVAGPPFWIGKTGGTWDEKAVGVGRLAVGGGGRRGRGPARGG